MKEKMLPYELFDIFWDRVGIWLLHVSVGALFFAISIVGGFQLFYEGLLNDHRVAGTSFLMLGYVWSIFMRGIKPLRNPAKDSEDEPTP